MSIETILFILVTLVAAVGGVRGALDAINAKHQRLPIEAERPLLERFCAGIVDYSVFALPDCRLALYETFLVLRGPGISLVINYGDIVSASTLLKGPRGAVLKTYDGDGHHTLKLFVGIEDQKIVDMLSSRGVSRADGVVHAR